MRYLLSGVSAAVACAIPLVDAALSPVAAQSAEMWGCTGSANIAWDQQITGCTNAILSKKYSGTGLVWAYSNRGIAWRNKGEFDRAIADITEAIRLDPLLRTANHTSAYFGRGNVYYTKKDYGNAIADYTRVIERDANDALALYWRGRARQMNGDKVAGDADIAAAKKINPQVGN